MELKAMGSTLLGFLINRNTYHVHKYSKRMTATFFRRMGVICLGLVANLCAFASFQVVNLLTEYTSCPMGLDEARPRFSWQMRSEEHGAAQAAYRLTLTDEQGQTVWDSGRITSSTSLAIPYAGTMLRPETRYQWTVQVWNQRGEREEADSWFETGLMETSDKAAAWADARWIGGDLSAMPFYSAYQSVFRICYKVEMEQRAALIFGANDPRLMDVNKNILGQQNQKDQSYIKVELAYEDSATVHVYRVGYTQKDRDDQPLQSVGVPRSLINETNRKQPHAVELAMYTGHLVVSVDGDKIGEMGLNPIGSNHDFICFPVLGDMGYEVPEGETARFTNVQVENYRSPRHALVVLEDATVSGERRLFTPKETGAVVLRRIFQAKEKPTKARLYVTARGVYDLTFNGQRLTDTDYLNPGLTQYNKTLFYQTYDVTPWLQQGENNWMAQLNEGWWSGYITYDPTNWNFFGDRQSLLAKLVLTYADGSVETIVTEPKAWEYATNGPLRYGSLFQGEVYDARIAEPTDWRPAEEVLLEGNISQGSNGVWPAVDDYSQFQLIGQMGNPVRENRVITAQRLEEPRKGVYVYDMGQNMAGVPKVTFRGLKPGTRVVMRFAEVKYPKLPDYAGNEDMIMLENIRAAMAQDIYIAKGGVETYQPRSTYHGYQYVEITGIPQALPVSDVKGVVLSSVEEITANYETSNPLLNRFFENVKWSSMANLFSIPTDCPQRNERMGWSGDLSVFSPTISYICNGAQFMRRHFRALRDTQEPDSAFAAIAPVGGGFGGPMWQSVGIVAPYQSYVQYNDVEAIREHYPAMKRYIQMVLRKYIDPVQGYFRGNDSPGDLGDWLGFEVWKNDNSLIFDSYLAYELALMERMAKALGETADAAYYARQRAKRIDFINTYYIDPTTGETIGSGLGGGAKYGSKPKDVKIDTQTSYAIPLALGIVKEPIKERFTQQLVNTVTRESVGDDGKRYPVYSLMTGFVGTPWITWALSENGRVEEAYRLLTSTGYPSWLYPVTQGATSIWERLNSMTHEAGFGGNNSMNSFNHYAFGSVTNWLMQRSLGIARDEERPGFQHFYLQPLADPTGALQYAKGYYDSPYGRIESSWEIKADGVEYRFTVPANSSATLRLRAKSLRSIQQDGGLIEKGAHFADGEVEMELVAGSYRFFVKK